MVESHQIKHWQLDHPDLDEPPKFRIKIISTFKDPLTRQVAESIRIERRGAEILNSKSEYSRCKIPRLKIDLEEWKRKESRPADTPLEVGSRPDTTPPGVPVKVKNDQMKDGKSSRRQDRSLKKAGHTTKNVKNKKRGNDRRPFPVGGQKKQKTVLEEK